MLENRKVIRLYDEILETRDFVDEALKLKNPSEIKNKFVNFLENDWEFITDFQEIEKLYLVLLDKKDPKPLAQKILNELNNSLALFDAEEIEKLRNS
jgi:hemerythrin superfamily protein